MTEQNELRRLVDEPMADGGEVPMSAAEEVLAWLLVEKIGVPDDVPYSPNQAQEIISRHLDRAEELDQIADMLSEGQGDDRGPAILPEFGKGWSVYAKVEACLHLLERRRDALSAPSPATAGVTDEMIQAAAYSWYNSKVNHDLDLAFRLVIEAALAAAPQLETTPAAFEVLDHVNGTYVTRDEQAALNTEFPYNGLYRRVGALT